jgi:hypothetical protein
MHVVTARGFSHAQRLLHSVRSDGAQNRLQRTVLLCKFQVCKITVAGPVIFNDCPAHSVAGEIAEIIEEIFLHS